MKNYKCFLIYLLLTFLGCAKMYAGEQEKMGRSFWDAIPVNIPSDGAAFTDVRDSYWYDYSSYLYHSPWDGGLYNTYGNAVFYRLEIEYMSDIVIHNWESPEVNCSTLFLVAPIDPYAEPDTRYNCDSVYDVALFMGGEVPDFDSLNAPPGTSRVLGYLRAERVPRGTYYLIVAGSKYMNGSIPNGLLRTTVTTTVCPFVPDETNYSSQYNSVHTLIPVVAGDTISMFQSAGSCRREMQYYDGLGRPVQHLSYCSSTEGRDLVDRQEYDILGRNSKQWLSSPYISDGNLSFIPDGNLEHESGIFYRDSCAFAYSIYDDSPLNRVKERYDAGKQWHMSGRSVKNDYRINIDADCCLNFYVSGAREMPVLSYSRFYAANSLSVVETQDEDGCRNCSFADEKERVILKRSIADADTLDTYYVYDDYDNLCFVLPPAASQNLPLLFRADKTNQEIQEIMEQYAYQYRYDYRNRCIGKKLPGCDWVEMIYDMSNRLMFSQDGRQRKKSEWSFSLSDLLGRSVLTGIYHGVPDVKECALSNIYATFEPTKDSVKYGYVIHVPEAIVSDSLEVLQANYYDTYDYRNYLSGFVPSLDYVSDEDYGRAYMDAGALHCKGLLTGSMTCTLGDNSKLYGCYYYDYNRNLVQERHTTLTDNIMVSQYSFSFNGQPVRSVEKYGDSIELKKNYIYDHVGRLTEEVHVLKDDTTRFIYEYDALGRMNSQVCVHDKDSLATENDYNIRSWLTAIRNPYFSQTLHYTDGKGTPYYNGNISSMTWMAGKSSDLCGYKFVYDGLNRMTDALYGEGNDLSTNLNYFNEQVMRYDKMGNILGLKRSGRTSDTNYGLIDNLSLTYVGNQLKKVTDKAISSTYGNGFDFIDGANKETEYEYDVNGNLIKDLNKKIADIQYNVLNLPCRIQFEDGNVISYLYDANGVKLRTTHVIENNTTITDYCGNVIYENGIPDKLLTGYGYISLNDNKYHYFIRDHQGNNRVVVDLKGIVEEVNHYYPFGGLMANSSTSIQPYKYNGKELDRKNGLDWYDYGARRYDATLGRWHVVDLLAENDYAITVYNYCRNNSVKLIDPDGMTAQIPPFFLGTSNPIITAGSRMTMLGTVDKVVKTLPKQESHHLISKSLKGNKTLETGRKGGFKLDGKENRLTVDKFSRITGKGQHGKHGNYTNQLRKKLEKFWQENPDASPEQCAEFIRQIVSEAKDIIESNPDAKINDLDLGGWALPVDELKVIKPVEAMKPIKRINPLIL